MIPASKFSEKTAVAAHEGTILGANVIPDGVEAPFRHFYGYLENGGAMAGHAHPTDEIYHIMRGHGTVIVGGHCRDVKAGDIVIIPANVWHTQICRDGGPYLWAAYWWDVIPEGRNIPEDRIVVKPFSMDEAEPSHNGTILGQWTFPEGVTAPFESAWGWMGPHGKMEPHRHHTVEVYIAQTGTAELRVGDETMQMEPGDVAVIPPDEEHTILTGDGEFLWLALWWPAD